METTKLSSRGQVVIPQSIRNELNLLDGTLFSVTLHDDSVCLRRIELPAVKTWKDAVKPFRDAARKSGFSKDDLDLLLAESRAR